MEPVLLDPVRHAAARCSLSAEAPAHLVDCDFIPPAELRSRQLERRGKGRAAAADHGDANRFVRWRHAMGGRRWARRDWRAAMGAGTYRRHDASATAAPSGVAGIVISSQLCI